MLVARPPWSVVRAVGAISLSALLASTAVLGSPASARARGFGIDPSPWVSVASSVASPFRPYLDQLAGKNAISTGSDGRLTILLLGSDTRAGGLGRTDTIMIVTLKDNTINAASIPRDTTRILNPFTAAPNDTFSPRVNAILKSFLKGSTPQEALAKFEVVIEQLLQIEIDYYAWISFKGFDALVDVVDPIYINNTQNIRDSRFWDDPRYISGVYFPPSSNYELYSLPNGPLCNGLWRTAANPATYACHRALPFVRSRKGPGNSDFQRARRQQNFVSAVIRAVIQRGSAQLGSVIAVANTQASAKALYTDIPFNSSAYGLFDDLQYASLANQVVFAPTTYSTHIPGTTAYELKLPAVRAWTAAYMK